MEHDRIKELLTHVDPSQLDYTGWVQVGMALKSEGLTASVWENWSKSDPRHKDGECFAKWVSFESEGVTAGTIYQFAVDQGYTPESKNEDDREIGWNDIIGSKDDYVVVDKHYLQGEEIHEPADWHPGKELARYLETLFDSTENVGYVTDSYRNEKGKYLPTKGNYDRTAGQLIQELNRHGDDIASVIGDYKQEAGAWIRFNPLDGKGVKNENVTDYRYALVESDTTELDKQNEIIRTLELPVACMVYSGNKSVHAIVKIEADDYEEYRKRVDYLYKICEKNGLKIDSQNRNPSRLSRMPGVVRNGHKQFIIDTNIGKSSWAEWQEWIEGVNDDLPDPENMLDVWDHMPPLKDSLIDGVLRKGHKMLLVGPSKAGKSFALIELCISLAEGMPWLGFRCAQGRVLYVNLELDRDSCMNRFKDVYTALGWPAKNVGNIDVWNLRGKAVPMDKLAPKLIRRAQKKSYVAVVIDPIYKVITGDENSADQMAMFCNQFDKVATSLECAVIYCHHHSKGAQGGKRSMDRASGSGVFARDPDALLDMTELPMSESIRDFCRNTAVVSACREILAKYNQKALGEFSDSMSATQAKSYTDEHLFGKGQHSDMKNSIKAAEDAIAQRTAWRLEGTLREFPTFHPIDLWFDYPTHHLDMDGTMKDVNPDEYEPEWVKAMKKRKTPEQKKEDRSNKLEIAFASLELEGKDVTYQALAEKMECTVRSAKSYVAADPGFHAEALPGGASKITRVPRNQEESEE